MVPYCVMVKGPCRGSYCDFWGRVKIRKSSVEELATGIRASVTRCRDNGSVTLEEVIREYWFLIGIRDMETLCEEEPDLCAKMIEAEVKAQT